MKPSAIDILIMKQTIIILFFLLQSVFVSGQNQHAYYSGINGQILLKVDSLSYKKENLYSEFFIDSVTNMPFTGIMTIRYVIDGFPSDSIYLKNGIIECYRKFYKVNYKKHTSKLYGFGYTDQNKKIEMYIGIKKGQKSKGKIIAVPYEYFIRFKKGKVFLIKRQNSKVITKLTFTNAEDFQLYIQTENEIFLEKCKDMGFFDKNITIPILNGNCNN